MSHSTVLVIGPKTDDELASALAPFDENIDVAPYIEATKADQIAARRKTHADAAENLRKYIAGERPYDRRPITNDVVAWITTGAPAEAALDDDALWAVILEKETWDERDEDGAIWSTYNPKSKWDWYVVGGRWDGALVLKAPVPADATARMDPAEYPVSHIAPEHRAPRDGHRVNRVDRLSDLDLAESGPTFAVLTPDGVWHERGHMGWWAMVADEKDPDVWDAEWRALIGQHLDQPAYLVDVHI